MQKFPPQVLDAWLDNSALCQVHRITGGLSSSFVWRVNSTAGAYCLKAWPKSSYSEERIRSIHDFMIAIHVDLKFVPKVILNKRGRSLLSYQDHLWDCTTWMSGGQLEPNTMTMSDSKLAVATLVQIHNCSAKFNREQGISPAVLSRMKLLNHYEAQLTELKSLANRLRQPSSATYESVAINSSTDEFELAQRTLNHFQQISTTVLRALQSFKLPILLHWVIRDLHIEHMLFDGGQVSGVIDFGAARVDEPLVDLVRLLGSMFPHNVTMRHKLVEHYLNQSKLSQLDLAASATQMLERFSVLDRASTLLSAMQWLIWLVVDRREFPCERSKLLSRWDNIVKRLDQDQW